MALVAQQALENSFVMHTFARKPVEFVSGSGIHLFDDAGRSYLDFLSGIGVVSLGHSHPALVSALAKQAETLLHVSNYFYIEGRGELAQTISELLNKGVQTSQDAVPLPVWKTFFANSGAEANECAIKLARLAARTRAAHHKNSSEDVPRLIVTLEGSFHGRTLAALAATAQAVKQEAFVPLPDGFLATPYNNVAALRDLFAKRGNEICAVILEVVQGESGVYPCSTEFLAEARRLTEEVGALLICDEVQCGIYRCGTYPFAFQHFGILPDIVTIAKGVASGMPCGMCVARSEVADAFSPGDHGSTFGGSCLAVAAARTTLAELEKMHIAEHVDEVGAYLKERLVELPFVAQVRGLGFMLAFECAPECPLDAPCIVERALEKGVVINATGPRTIRLLPPLICEKLNVDELIDILKQIVEEA